MAEGFASGTAASILDAIGNATAYSVATPFIQLHTAAPGAAGTTAIASNNTRKSVSFGAASGGSISNDAAIDWTNVPASEDYTHFTIWTAVSAGTFVCSGTITASAVTTGDNFTIPIGDLDLTIPVAS